MSANESRAAVDRLAGKREDLGAEDFGAYAFLLLGILAYQAPEVVQFVLDRADERLAAPPASETTGDEADGTCQCRPGDPLMRCRGYLAASADVSLPPGEADPS